MTHNFITFAVKTNELEMLWYNVTWEVKLWIWNICKKGKFVFVRGSKSKSNEKIYFIFHVFHVFRSKHNWNVRKKLSTWKMRRNGRKVSNFSNNFTPQQLFIVTVYIYFKEAFIVFISECPFRGWKWENLIILTRKKCELWNFSNWFSSWASPNSKLRT